MKRILLSIVLVAAISATTFAQSKKKASDGGDVFEKGAKVLSLGIAPVSSFGLPINASFEYGVTDNIGVGVTAGYASKSYSFGTGSYKVTYMLFGLRGNYHHQFVEKLDTYAGLTLGYNAASVDWPTSWGTIGKPTVGGILLGGHIGARYYFTPKIAANVELGRGIGTVNIGLALKL